MHGRLSRMAAAMVIARRDFTAILLKRSFILFLLSPFFPAVVSVIAGGIGSEVRDSVAQPELGVAMPARDVDALMAAHRLLAPKLGGAAPQIKVIARLPAGAEFDPHAALKDSKASYAAVLSGTLDSPRLTGPAGRIEAWQGPVSLIAAQAMGKGQATWPGVTLAATQTSQVDLKQGQAMTAQIGQMIMFLLMMLLAGMVLSNLVEEKGNKIIEILAAALPMDAVFLGKLFAMLAISWVGILVWGASGVAVVAFAGQALPNLPEPAVGWPMFALLFTAYFSMGYLLIGSVFLAVGSMAPTVRDVQSLSMPASMVQLLLFLIASNAVARPGTIVEYAAMAVPFSSPFAMLARAAQDGALWPHAVALGWQALCVAVFIRVGAQMFRKWVMKSGGAGSSSRKRGFFGRRKAIA